MSLAIAERWFAQQSVDDSITLLYEPEVHPLLRCNIWHVRGRKRDLVIDTGLGVASLAEAAADLFGTDLLAVATHSHMDHLGGFHEFEHRAIHELESDSAKTAAEGLPLDIADYDEDTLSWFADIGYDISGGLLSKIPYEGFNLAEHVMVGAAPNMLLSEGDVIDLGDRAFEVLHLPGHSPGSIGLWEERTGTLFSGDAVYDGPLLDQIPGADIESYTTTMERLATLPVNVAHGGHNTSMDRARFRSIVTDYLKKGEPSTGEPSEQASGETSLGHRA